MKSERHHWWPKCMSKHWADPKGGVHWLRPDGSVLRAKPASFGMIGNGHFIKLGKEAGETTPWDQNFERFFQQADNAFPTVISWLEGLGYENRTGKSKQERFVPAASRDEQFGRLVEAIISLAVRSPMTREAAVAAAEMFRGPLAERERNKIITLNLRDMHRRAVQSFGTRGKATVILSPDRELIFVDGFYHNLSSPGGAPSSPRILAPLTPRLAVLYAIPLRYSSEPRLSTLVIGPDEAEGLNEVVQVYSRECLFYRVDKPNLTENYIVGKHLFYSSSNNIVDIMIDEMAAFNTAAVR